MRARKKLFPLTKSVEPISVVCRVRGQIPTYAPAIRLLQLIGREKRHIRDGGEQHAQVGRMRDGGNAPCFGLRGGGHQGLQGALDPKQNLFVQAIKEKYVACELTVNRWAFHKSLSSVCIKQITSIHIVLYVTSRPLSPPVFMRASRFPEAQVA